MAINFSMVVIHMFDDVCDLNYSSVFQLPDYMQHSFMMAEGVIRCMV